MMASQITANDKIGKFQGRGETTVFSFDKFCKQDFSCEDINTTLAFLHFYLVLNLYDCELRKTIKTSGIYSYMHTLNLKEATISVIAINYT